MTTNERISRFVSRARRRRGAGVLSAETARVLDRASAGGDLYLRARRLADGLHQGRHRTPHRGASIEFFDFRQYAPGDPVSRIDWKLLGRTDRPFIRRFHQDAQLSVTIVLDASASMEFASLGGDRSDATTKLDRARELAAALAFLAVRQGDRAGLVVVGAGATRVLAPASGWGALHAIVREIERAAPESGERDATLASGLDAAALALRDRGIVVAIGDALEDAGALLDAMARLRSSGRGGGTARRAREVALIHLLAPDELAIPATHGAARLVDPETMRSVRTNPATIRDGYAGLVREHCERLRQGMLAMDGRCVLATTSDEPLETLRRLLVPRS